VVEVYAGIRMDEVVVRAEVEVERVVECGKGESKRVVMSEGDRARGEDRAFV
jgi:hypothetical protein